jgi:hypothetical protein
MLLYFAARRHAPLVLTTALAALLTACSTRQPAPALEKAAPEAQAQQGPTADLRVSQATSARAYRKDAAAHIYAVNAERIYKGKMPPLLYAVGVLQVEVDGRGNVRSISWMRAPRHAPEVIAEIERTVRAAAPFPSPTKMGHVVYTDTWLWDKSGRFQLDTLTEGQL